MASDVLGHLVSGLSFEVGSDIALKSAFVLHEKIGVIKKNKMQSFDKFG